MQLILPPKCCSRCLSLQYFASGPIACGPSSTERSSETSEAPETVEAIDGLLENAAAAVGNTVEPVVSDREREELEQL